MENKFSKWCNGIKDPKQNELVIEGAIDSETWWGDEATPEVLRSMLNLKSGDLTVILNSPGGDVFAGLAMYNALKNYDGKVTIRVDGLAASIASIIAMAGDEIIMSEGAMIMLHKPSVVAAGNSKDMEKAREALEEIEASLIPIYAKRTGLSDEEISQMLEAETWLSAEKAVAMGFADKVAEAVTEEAVVASARLVFSMSALNNSLTSLRTAIKNSTEETTEETTEAEVETEAVAEVVETAEDINKEPKEEAEEKEEEEMEDNKNIAMQQVELPKAKSEQLPTNYLKSKQSLVDFENVLRENAGREAKDVKAAWEAHAVTMGLTNSDEILPEAVVTSIKDAFAQGGEIWSLVNKTGLDVISTAWDTIAGEDSRAKGHKRGTNKQEEVITLAKRTIRGQYIYKYLTLNKEDVRENKGSGALLRYVLAELPKRIIREIERAILIGDGRADTSDLKITSFTSIKEDAEATDDTFAVVYTPVVGESHYASILKAADLLKSGGAVHLVSKKGYMTSLRLEKNADGSFVFPAGVNVVDALGLAGNIQPDWFDDAADAENDAYLVSFAEYNTVGDTSVEAFSNFSLKENKNEYLQELYTGGALMGLVSAVAIKKTPTA